MSHCPHPNCGKFKPSGIFCCKPHWIQLPLEIRAKVLSGYRHDRQEWLAGVQEAKKYWNERIKVREQEISTQKIP